MWQYVKVLSMKWQRGPTHIRTSGAGTPNTTKGECLIPTIGLDMTRQITLTHNTRQQCSYPRLSPQVPYAESNSNRTCTISS